MVKTWVWISSLILVFIALVAMYLYFNPEILPRVQINKLLNIFQAHQSSNNDATESQKSFTLKVPILMYHHIGNPEKFPSGLAVAAKNLEEQLTYLQNQGYIFIDLDLLYDSLKNKKSLGVKNIILSFDDGYEDFYLEAFPILKARKIKATLFIIVNKIGTTGYLDWSQIRELVSSGLITIGSHTLNHTSLSSQNLTSAKKEIFESKKIIENHLGKRVDYFSYPYGTNDVIIAKLLEQAGYKAAVTTIQGIDQTFTFRYWWERVRIGSGYTGKSIENLIRKYILMTNE